MADKTTIRFDNTYDIIDLTQPLRLDAEVYPGDPKPIRHIFSKIKNGSLHYVHELSDHAFRPHGDAPNHQNPDIVKKGFESYGIEFAFNRACLIDLSSSSEAHNISGIRHIIRIEKKHLEPYKKLLKNRGAVIIRTGYDICLEKNMPHVPKNLPYLSKGAAEFLASLKTIKVVGTDSITVDQVGKCHAHKALKRKLIVEGIVRLHKIPGKHSLDFILQTTPLRIVGATGGPIIAYAYVPR